jgi:hypothetical protein
MLWLQLMLQADKNPPICVGENLISQYFFFSFLYFLISSICFSLNLIVLLGLSVKSNLVLQSILFDVSIDKMGLKTGNFLNFCVFEH